MKKTVQSSYDIRQVLEHTKYSRRRLITAIHSTNATSNARRRMGNRMNDVHDRIKAEQKFRTIAQQLRALK